MRVRRTNKELEQDIFDAVTKLSMQEDMTKITLRKVANEAQIDMKVLKRRYADVTQLLKAYSGQFDKRLQELMKSGDHIQDKPERYGYILGKFLDWVSEHDQIRQLLIWELDGRSELGYRTGQQRDLYLTKLFTEDFSPQIKGSTKEYVRGLIILYLAGITYLYINGKDSVFMGIKFFTEEGKDNLRDGMMRLLKIYFAL